MVEGLDFAPARTPRTLWVELTSKCPFDCIFCSRATRRGAGTHLPLELYSALVDGLADPRKLILNYSGESTIYPHLIEAIQRARATGAVVEMVTALATAPDSLLRQLTRSGLNRLTVSVHAAEPEKFFEVYRHSSFTKMRHALERLVSMCRTEPEPPVIDLAFVAMEANLGELVSVASLASRLQLRDLTVFPVLRRDEIPARFDEEIASDGSYRSEFITRVAASAEQTRQILPNVRVSICNAAFTEARAERLGEVPVPWPGALPQGAAIHTCEQNPWETTHILSSGDVVACEVLDKISLGNLNERSMEEIWHGEGYKAFRERYRRGQVPECRACPWKQAYLPGPLTSEILASRGGSAQLLHGWHDCKEDGHIWSSQRASAVLVPRPRSRTVHVSGILPPGPKNQPNCLCVRLNGVEIGTVSNPWEEMMPFGLDFDSGGDSSNHWMLEFRTTHVCRPVERGEGTDQRDLGFALVLLVSKPYTEPEQAARNESLLYPLRTCIDRTDRWAMRLARHWRRAEATAGAAWRPGLCVLIPEWDNATELAECLASIKDAASDWSEPLHIVVTVNGSPRSAYTALRKRHPETDWQFHDRPLGFGGAVEAGLQSVRHDWVYLLNSDVTLARNALCEVGRMRAAGVFSIGSQIVLKDTTRFRDETNWTTLRLEDGLVTIHDRIPTDYGPAPNFYSGGGASLFRTPLLKRVLDAGAYHPFYWEDVEWGWRARKLGYQSVFCPGSTAYHTRRSTISRHNTADEVENIVQRNRLLFQLRNFTSTESLERVFEEIARAPDSVAAHFLSRQIRLTIARGRLWNWLAPVSDAEVFERWNASVATDSARV